MLEEIQEAIKADWLIYQDLEDLVSATCDGADVKYDFDCSVFNNQYITGDIDDAYLNDLQSRRSEAKKKKANQESGIIDLHNDEAVE